MVQPWTKGYNTKRQEKLRAGSKVTPDEDMLLSWTGKKGVGGMPHVSFVARKPKSLGCELKSVCDAGTGIKLFIEIQEGKIKDARKEFRLFIEIQERLAHIKGTSYLVHMRCSPRCVLLSLLECTDAP